MVRRISAFLTVGVRGGVASPIIDSVFGLDRVVDAHHRMEQRQQVGKIVVTV